MKKLKSHFWYTKNQRNGILFLVVIILLTQFLYHSISFESESHYNFKSSNVIAFQNQIDSLKLLELEKRKPKIYPFNPNFISDYKGYQLGMSPEEIDRLHLYRTKGKYVNSKKEFQTVTKVSDSLLNAISPYFKFPDWTKKKKIKSNKSNFNFSSAKDKSKISTKDLNLATQNDFLVINEVDDVISERIIKYRTKLQGFSYPDQLFEVWGLKRKVGKKILETFSIITKPTIKKVNVNTASFKEVLAIPYIDYELCVKIFEFRDEVAELQSISELKNIEGFPLDKYERIVLYLLAE